MYIVVQGRAEAERCRLAMTFGPQSDWTRSDAGPGPTWAELDRAQSLPQPAWISHPDANSFARHYPDDALERGIGGEAILDCLVLENGVLHCRLIHETPVERVRSLEPAGRLAAWRRNECLCSIWATLPLAPQAS